MYITFDSFNAPLLPYLLVKEPGPTILDCCYCFKDFIHKATIGLNIRAAATDEKPIESN